MLQHHIRPNPSSTLGRLPPFLSCSPPLPAPRRCSPPLPVPPLYPHRFSPNPPLASASPPFPAPRRSFPQGRIFLSKTPPCFPHRLRIPSISIPLPILSISIQGTYFACLNGSEVAGGIPWCPQPPPLFSSTYSCSSSSSAAWDVRKAEALHEPAAAAALHFCISLSVAVVSSTAAGVQTQL